MAQLKVSNAVSDAFDCDFCKGTIKKIVISNSGGDGLDISGSNIEVSEMIATNIKDKAFSVGENSVALINDASFSSVATGIAVKDASLVRASKISLENIAFDAFMSYVKKPFYYGNTRLEVADYNIDNYKVNKICAREIGTDLIVNNKDCDISKIDINELYEGRMKK